MLGNKLNQVLGGSQCWGSHAQTVKSTAVANYRLEDLRPLGSYPQCFYFPIHIIPFGPVRKEVAALNECVWQRFAVITFVHMWLCL